MQKYVAELPDGLLSVDQHPELVEIATELTQARQLDADSEEIATINETSIGIVRNVLGLDHHSESARITLLRYLISLMYQISCIEENRASNRMDTHNMALCIGPSIFGTGQAER